MTDSDLTAAIASASSLLHQIDGETVSHESPTYAVMRSHLLALLAEQRRRAEAPPPALQPAAPPTWAPDRTAPSPAWAPPFIVTCSTPTADEVRAALAALDGARAIPSSDLHIPLVPPVAGR